MYMHTQTFSSLENCIDGIEFLLLQDEEVKRMVPPLGLAKKIIHLIPRPAVMTYYSRIIVEFMLLIYFNFHLPLPLELVHQLRALPPLLTLLLVFLLQVHNMIAVVLEEVVTQDL